MFRLFLCKTACPIDENSSQTSVKSLCPSFSSFFLYRATRWQVIDVFCVGIAFHLLTNVFDFIIYLAAPYDIFGYKNTALYAAFMRYVLL